MRRSTVPTLSSQLVFLGWRVNDDEKKFITSSTEGHQGERSYSGVNSIKLFTAVIYEYLE
jgi:hypothetical protein